MTPAFGENGHLHELGLHALHVGELEADVATSAETHLASCAVCAANFASVQAFAHQALPLMRVGTLRSIAGVPDAVADLAANTGRFGDDSPAASAPAATTSRVVPRSLGRFVPVLAAALAAAVALFAVSPMGDSGDLPAIVSTPSQLEPELDVFTAKGSEFRFSVYRQVGSTAETLVSGAKVQPHDRLSFRIHNPESGYLAIAGVDSTGVPWSAYPASVGMAAAISPAPAGQDLPTGVELDGALGTERLVAVYCPTSVPWSTLSDALTSYAARSAEPLPPLIPGCLQRELSLEKTKL